MGQEKTYIHFSIDPDKEKDPGMLLYLSLVLQDVFVFFYIFTDFLGIIRGSARANKLAYIKTQLYSAASGEEPHKAALSGGLVCACICSLCVLLDLIRLKSCLK